MKQWLLVLPVIIIVLSGCVRQPTTTDTAHGPQRAIAVTNTTFSGYVDSASVALVEFYSEHCLTCASLTWVIDSLHASFSDTAFIGANNIDSDDSLWRTFPNVTVPSYLFFSKGQLVARRGFSENIPGVYDTLAAILQQLLDSVSINDTIPDDTIPHDTVPENYLTLTTKNFDSTILRDGVVAMVFLLVKNGLPCIHMDSVVAVIAPHFIDRAVIAKSFVIWDSTDLADRYNITRVPHFLFFKNGTENTPLRIVDIVSGDSLIAVLELLLSEEPVDRTVLLDSNTFDATIQNAPVAMVEFFSPTCGACIHMEPVVAALADTFNGTALIAKVNVTTDNSLRVAHGISGWPTFLFYRNGSEYHRIVGGRDIDTLAAAVRRGFASALPQ